LAGMIFAASGRGEIAGPPILGFDKVAHFFVFGLLATLVVRNGFAARRAWMAVALVSAFGASDEWHQSMTPGRAMQLADWVADTLGAAVAVAAYAGWPLYRRVLEIPLAAGPKSRIEKKAQMPPNGGVV
ncbi:MAG: VanZ family protein, partial [Candidatus Didemnitutus sp.]|nr:VanZ family protein [Candidatus Didemnitutus sp.]